MTIEDDIAFLETVPTLKVLGPNALKILAIGVESRSLLAGETLFATGDRADAAYLLQQGSLRIKANPSEPDDKSSVVGRGTLLGEFALITDTQRSTTAVAAEPSVVIRIPRTLFLKMLDGVPEAARHLRNHLATRVERTADEIYSVRTTLDPASRRRS